jgi:hypothetical protein
MGRDDKPENNRVPVAAETWNTARAAVTVANALAAPGAPVALIRNSTGINNAVRVSRNQMTTGNAGNSVRERERRQVV